MSDAPKDDALFDDEALMEALPDAEILKALAPYTVRGRAGIPGADRLRTVERRQLVRCEVVRFTQKRDEVHRTAFGTKDLSALPLYEGSIHDHPLPEPEGPATLTLIRAGSLHPVLCPCDNGAAQCTSCTGRGWHRCSCHSEPPPCDACLNVTPCTACEKAGRSPVRAKKVRPAAGGVAATAPGAPRVVCARCRTAEAACPRCQGRGLRQCPHCEGRGREDCRRCSGQGVRTHDVCGGKGSITRWVEGTVTYAHEPRPLSLPPRDWPDKVEERLTATAHWRKHDVPAGDLGSVFRILPGSRSLAPRLAALSSVANSPVAPKGAREVPPPRCLHPPPCDPRHQTPLPDPA